MSAEILPAASLRSISRLPAARVLAWASNYLILMVLWSIGWAIFQVESNFLPALREEELPACRRGPAASKPGRPADRTVPVRRRAMSTPRQHYRRGHLVFSTPGLADYSGSCRQTGFDRHGWSAFRGGCHEQHAPGRTASARAGIFCVVAIFAEAHLWRAIRRENKRGFPE
jgi:hypothetical protein